MGPFRASDSVIPSPPADSVSLIASVRFSRRRSVRVIPRVPFRQSGSGRRHAERSERPRLMKDKKKTRVGNTKGEAIAEHGRCQSPHTFSSRLTAVNCNTLQYPAVQYSAVQCSAVQYSGAQNNSTTTQHNTSHHSTKYNVAQQLCRTEYSSNGPAVWHKAYHSSAA